MRRLLFAPMLIFCLSHQAASQGTEILRLRLLSYNVAGLPDFISSSSPAKNTSAIGEAINQFDIVLLQEDFNYHHKLVEKAQHPNQSKSSGPAVFGDGLNRFSFPPFQNFKRIKWNKCHGVFTHGSDCLTPKGFSVASHEISPGFYIDIYNLHADAGSDSGSLKARRDNLRQLLSYIEQHSAKRPVIVMGDFNSRYTRSGDIPEIFLEAGFHDAWLKYHNYSLPPEKGASINLGCDSNPSGDQCELIDKIFFRSAHDVALQLLHYEVPDEQFQDLEGRPLSDHLPVAAEFQFIIDYP